MVGHVVQGSEAAACPGLRYPHACPLSGFWEAQLCSGSCGLWPECLCDKPGDLNGPWFMPFPPTINGRVQVPGRDSSSESD